MKALVGICMLFAGLSASIAVVAVPVASANDIVQPVGLIGEAVPGQGPADQVVVLTRNTPYVNVTAGSTVRFVFGDRSFRWRFDSAVWRVIRFDLERIAPKGLLDHRVMVYVADNPLYLG